MNAFDSREREKKWWPEPNGNDIKMHIALAQTETNDIIERASYVPNVLLCINTTSQSAAITSYTATFKHWILNIEYWVLNNELCIESIVKCYQLKLFMQIIEYFKRYVYTETESNQ